MFARVLEEIDVVQLIERSSEQRTEVVVSALIIIIPHVISTNLKSANCLCSDHNKTLTYNNENGLVPLKTFQRFDKFESTSVTKQTLMRVRAYAVLRSLIRTDLI